MALKKLLTEEEFNALPDVIKAEYKKSDKDGKYHLDLDDDDSALKNALERERQEKAEMAARLKEKEDAEAAAKAAAEEAERQRREQEAKDKGDINALEKSWQQKLEEAKAEGQRERALAMGALHSHLVKTEAARIAAEISTVPSLLQEVVEKRMQVEINETGVPVIRVLDAQGHKSALSVADLQKEFVDNPAYKSIIKASKASGGGASGSQHGGGASWQGKSLKDMNGTEEVQYANAHPEEYKRWVEGGRK